MREPGTPEEWQQAVDAAYACLALDSARRYGLIQGGPSVDVARCEEILRQGATRGICPNESAIDRLAVELAAEPSRGSRESRGRSRPVGKQDGATTE